MEEARRPYLLALRMLTRRDHSVAELREKLTARGFSPAAVTEVVSRLATDGYLDDRRFAETLAAALLRSGRGYGPRLKLELRRRGIAEEIIGETLAALADEQPERDVLSQVVSRRFNAFDPALASDRERSRVFGYLQRRGFSLAAILAHFRERTSGDL